jgi:hypothetical protein
MGLSCCWSTVCLECVENKLRVREEDETTYLKCRFCTLERIPTTGVNRALKEAISQHRLDFGSIICDRHTDEVATHLIPENSKLCCMRCYDTSEAGLELDMGKVESWVAKAIAVLEAEQESVRKLSEELSRYRSKTLSIKGSRFIEIAKDVALLCKQED